MLTLTSKVVGNSRLSSSGSAVEGRTRPEARTRGSHSASDQPRLAQFLQEQGVDLFEFLALQGPAAVGHREEGLDAAGGPGDDADGAGGRHGGDRGVAPGRLALALQRLLGKLGKGPRCAARLWDWATARSWMRAMMVSASVQGFRGIVGHPSLMNKSASPMTPRPILRLAGMMAVIWGRG